MSFTLCLRYMYLALIRVVHFRSVNGTECSEMSPGQKVKSAGYLWNREIKYREFWAQLPSVSELCSVLRELRHNETSFLWSNGCWMPFLVQKQHNPMCSLVWHPVCANVFSEPKMAYNRRLSQRSQYMALISVCCAHPLCKMWRYSVNI